MPQLLTLAAVCRSVGAVELTGLSVEDGKQRIWKNWCKELIADTKWEGWELWTEGEKAAKMAWPAGGLYRASREEGSTYFFYVREGDNRLYARWTGWEYASGWSEWSAHSDGLDYDCVPALACDSKGALHIFTVMGGTMGHKGFAGDSWTTYPMVHGVTSRPLAAVYPDGKPFGNIPGLLVVFETGDGGQELVWGWLNGNRMSWRSLGHPMIRLAYDFAKAPAFSLSGDELNAYVNGVDGNIYYRTCTATTQHWTYHWTDWQSLGRPTGTKFENTQPVGSRSNLDPHTIFAIAQDGHLYSTQYNAGKKEWTGWDIVGGHSTKVMGIPLVLDPCPGVTLRTVFAVSSKTRAALYCFPSTINPDKSWKALPA